MTPREAEEAVKQAEEELDNLDNELYDLMDDPNASDYEIAELSREVERARSRMVRAHSNADVAWARFADPGRFDGSGS